ncbi:type II secretion system protein N [Piscinibacter sp. XHJ-5]|uniref:type II secretion system protein N n=1 Tax=Piscinibacter sp. XHJ-5 TaxID=3037797 RepID=UPI0024530EAC|nr:type II secretion system protein N [Piscinibacter sp. XHJ-5]
MPARLSAFVIWALVAACAVFWGLRLAVRAPSAPVHTVAVGDSAPVRADLTRLFGAPPVAAMPSAQAPALASRFQLTGVMAPKAPGDHGVALIAVDGKMPRAYRVGSAIDGELVLQSVSLRTAAIGPARGATAVVLEVPPLPVAATGTLPAPMPITPPAAGPVPPMPVPPTPVAPVSPAAPPTMPGAVATPGAVPASPGVVPAMPGGARGPLQSRSAPGTTPREMQERSPAVQ